MPEIVFCPVLRFASGLEFLGQGFGRGTIMRGAMARVFGVDGIVRNGAAQQARLRPIRRGKSGDFAQFLSGARFFGRFQVFGSPKPVANQQKPTTTLHFLNYRVASPLFRLGIRLGVFVARLFSSLRKHWTAPRSFPCIWAASSVAR